MTALVDAPTLVDAARGWRELGFVPIAARNKRPLAAEWQRLDADEHLARIVAEPPEQIGIRMGAQPDGRILIAIDVDGDEGRRSLAKLMSELGELPRTCAQRTGGGGAHFIYQWPVSRASDCPTTSAGKLGAKLDIRGERGQIIAAPSVHESGRCYELADKEDPAPVLLPDAWVERIVETHRPPPPATNGAGQPVTLTAPATVTRCLAYVAAMPPAISGSGGHGNAWRVAQVAVRGFALGRSDALAVLREYNTRCQPPWNERELEHKLDSAEARSRMARGCLLERNAPWRADWDPEPLSTGSLVQHNGAETADMQADPQQDEPEGEPAHGLGARGAKPDTPPRRTAQLPALTSARELIAAHRARLASIASGDEAPITTGFAQLDEQLDGGLWPGLGMLVGSTGSSKTQLAMQVSLYAAQQGTPVAYVLFEMDGADGMHRLMGEVADVSWSKLQRGRASAEELARVEAQYEQLPSCLYLEAAEPYRWPSARVMTLAQQLRALRPAGPLLMIVDYTQLSGDMAEDTRQRVMRVALELQTAAKRYRIAALAVSSTGRPGYAVLADFVARAGISDEPTQFGRRRALTKPHEIIGLGKECGELEYSADYVTVLGSGGESESTGKLIIAATAKRRTGAPSWCALRQDRGRLRSAPDIQTADDLPAAQSADALDERVVEAVGGTEYTSQDELRADLGCQKQSLVRSLRRLETNGRLQPKRQRQPFRLVGASGGSDGAA